MLQAVGQVVPVVQGRQWVAELLASPGNELVSPVVVIGLLEGAREDKRVVKRRLVLTHRGPQRAAALTPVHRAVRVVLALPGALWRQPVVGEHVHAAVRAPVGAVSLRPIRKDKAKRQV